MILATLLVMSAIDDPYAWLEDVGGEKQLAWVKARNVESHKELASAELQALESNLLTIFDSTEKIPYVEKIGDHFYNFWRDAGHVRGMWRRTTLAEYRKPQPQWETVLDVDALGAAEKENWVFHGAECLKPDNTRCLVSLSRGGADASVVREFDLVSKSFVNNGFVLPEAKSGSSWVDRDTLFIGTDFGPGSLTSSGYPRVVKKWKRGTPLASATVVFEGKTEDISANVWHDHTPGYARDLASRRLTFFSSELYWHDGKSFRKLDVPDDSKKGVNKEWLLIELRSAWTVAAKTYPAGALLAARLTDYVAGKREFALVFEPTPTSSLADYAWTKDFLILNVLDDVKSRLSVVTPGTWKQAPLQGAPAIGTVSAFAVDEHGSNDFFMTVTDFLTPTSLYYGTLGSKPEKVKAQPAFFDVSGLEVSQHFVASRDGTRIPYFQVSPKGMTLDGTHPTLLTGYGGFEVSEVPYYSGAAGRAWLSKGYVYVLANIRGGGEYGPRWHQAALKQNRQRAYEDFAAVAQDLVARKVTSAKHLGTQGASNGGLLMGNMLTQYPHLFGAIVCQVPLLDMKRYSHLLAGASWMGEYGDPDKPEEWKFIEKWSPYHNVAKGKAYPPTLFMTSTRDDRVHPAHARKMMAKLMEQQEDVRYYENIEGGHGGAADNKQAAHMWALAYTFLAQKLNRR